MFKDTVFLICLFISHNYITN